MISGIGVDIVKVNRFDKIVNRTPSFVKGVFTEREIEYIYSKTNKFETMAGIFAAKEAFSKAIGTGIRGFKLTDIEIVQDELGKPNIILNDNVISKFNLLESNIKVSISHSDENAIAFVVIEEE
ncbi:holo-ACP synthase [Clostridium sp. MSJ-8]|uniref:holo-ACP synthase n=1 Tax=Clostridium sp. MSJ-8 TaxID=2841510 RepID=UPI001C0EA3DF|nr:holo-ACP synthase [Clostridium sp. MSJ-8]MBU5488334.1 holo-ACP synthase [Clostridium sp. MSJ-8]